MIFLILLFPEDAVRTFIEKNIKRVDPALSLEIGGLGLGVFPPGIRLSEPAVYYENRFVIQPDGAAFSPVVSTIFGGKPAFRFKIRVFDGVVQGRCRLDCNADNQGHAGTLDAKISGIDLGTLKELKELLDYPLSGTIDGRVTGTINGAAYQFSSEFSVKELGVIFEPPLMGMDKLTFKTVEAELAGDEQSLTVNRCVARGGQMDVEFTGDIRLRRPYPESVLDLEGFVKPHSDFVKKLGKILPLDLIIRKNPGQKGYPVRIDGTVSAPGVSIQ